MNFKAYLASRKQRVDETLDRLLPAGNGGSKTVAEAMRYAVFGGGKRLRPILVLAAHEACGGDTPPDESASAMELIHTYSLIHDDLPAMDDDDLRRGQPTVHRAFGEAEAILAGDALLTLAFEVLADHPRGEAFAPRRARAVAAAARGAGIGGMIGGQIGDLEAQGADIDPDRLAWIHRHKTGALFAASARLGAIHAGAAPETLEAMGSYGEMLGLAFQVADDILDCTATADQLGKTPGKDQRAGKATYPALLGLDAARRRGDEFVTRALESLRSCGLLTPTLESLATYSVSRNS